MKHVFVRAFLVFTFQNAYTQHTIDGTVKDKNEPIDFAQVYVQEMDGTILSYVFSDSLGSFSLMFETNSDSVKLNVARLGYEPLDQVIAANQKHLDIQLSLSEASKLREIIITEGRPIESQGDTINYFVQPFSDGSEKNVEDLLAKLPGVSVDEQSGTIKYQGEEIKKILLDGDDLTGDNYKVLSKNLSADWLEEVEILKRFTDSRLLHGIQQSNEVAINLKLKEEVKVPLFGTIEPGGGNTAKYSAKTELLSYLKKLKLFASGEANNTGIGLQSYDLETYTSSRLEYKGFILPDRVIENQLTPPSFLKQERFTFHEGQFFSNNLVANLSPESSLRSITSLYNNDINFNFSDSLHYLLPSGDGFSFTQRQRQNQRPFEFFQDIKVENRLSSNQDLIIRFQNKYSTDEPLTENLTGFSVFTDQAEIATNEWFGGLSYLYKVNSNWVNTFDFEVGSNQVDELFILSEENTSGDSILQTTDQDFFNLGLFDRLDGVVRKNWFVNILGGWSQNSSDFTYVRNRLVTDNPTSNPYQFDHLFAEFKLERKLKESRVSLGGRIRNVAIEYNDESFNHSYFEPTVSASTKKVLGKIKTEIKGLYNIEYVFLKPDQLINNPLLSNYRTSISFTSDSNTPIKNEIGVATIKLTGEGHSYLSANAKWVYLKSSSILTSQLLFPENAVTNNQLQNGVSESFFSTYSVDKYFSKIKSTIKIAYDYNQSSTPLSIEGSPDDSQLKQSMLSITSGSSITKQVSLSWAFKSYESTNRWGGDENSFSFRSYFFKIVYKPVRSLRVTFDYQGINFRKTDEFSDILNASVSYPIVEDKFSVAITGNNILDQNAVILSTIEPSVFSNSLYPLQPRFVLISAEYKF